MSDHPPRGAAAGTLLPRLGALVAMTFWGVSFVATKLALREVPPITLIFTRFALGSALLLGILLARGEPLLPPRDCWRGLALMGFIGVFVHQLLQANALTLTTAAHTGWLIGLTPIWTAVLAKLFLGEGFGPMKLTGLGVGCAGALLVVTRGRFTTTTLALPATRGDLLILLSTVNWAIYTALGHATLRRLGSSRATAGAMTIGWLMVVPLFVLHGGWRPYAALSVTGWGALLFLGIACSGLGYLFWFGALERLEASKVAAFLYLEPLVTLAAAAAVLGEPIGASTLVGGALVLLGVALVQVAGARPTRNREA